MDGQWLLDGDTALWTGEKGRRSMRLVLDVGSGASLPDDATARRFVDEVKKRDTGKHKIVFKAQLFREAPPNIPLDWNVWLALHAYGGIAGYEVTASVFDMDCLGFLLGYVIPFVKIACRPDLYWLADEVPRRVPVWVSWDCRGDDRAYSEALDVGADLFLACVPKYPAAVSDFGLGKWRAVSDHTVGWDLYQHMQEYQPEIDIEAWEKHFRLPDTTGPDAGPWAVTPDQLAEIIS